MFLAKLAIQFFLKVYADFKEAIDDDVLKVIDNSTNVHFVYINWRVRIGVRVVFGVCVGVSSNTCKKMKSWNDLTMTKSSK